MKTNFQLLLATLGIFLLALIVNDPFGWRRHSYSDSKPLLNISADAVKEITIADQADSFTIARDANGSWDQITQGQNRYRADAEAVQKALLKILEIRRYSRVGSASAFDQKLGISAQGLQVTLKADKDYTVLIGNTAENGVETMVRLADEKSIYSARDNLAMTFQKGVEFFRSKSFLLAAKENIRAIRYSGKTNLQLVLEGADWKNGTRIVKPEEISKILDALVTLKAEYFEAMPKLPLNSEITVELQSGPPKRIEIRGPDTNNKLYAVSTDLPDGGTIAPYRMDQIVPKEENLYNEK